MVRIAIIGTGGMAGWHARRFSSIKASRLVACCDIVPGRAAAFAEQHKIPGAYESAEDMFAHEKLDAVSIVAVDRAHAPLALLAMKHGLHVMCEKPLATSLKDARRMAAEARQRKLLTAVNFSYRNNPATQKAAALVAAGRLGRIIHVEGSYLQSWLVSKIWGDWRTSEAMMWRLSTRHGSGGTLCDIGVHLYDLASFVVGDIVALTCDLKTFDKGVKRIGQYVFDANDSMVATVHFKNGALGTLHSSRWAVGHANTVALRVYGDKGGLDLNLDRPAPDTLRVCWGKNIAKAQWKPVPCPPVPDMAERFVTSLLTRKQGQTGFAGGARVQAYLEYSLRSARQGGAWMKVKM
ncbi:MAG: Gfo/Idh/MocA family oxidoreductase [Planctomycetota bacterium]|nr:Gfo/Idh/MocA family oxidoreductase [Planctomycetota bacterium]